MSLKSRIETVLFVIAKSVTIKEIAEILNEEEPDIEEAIIVHPYVRNVSADRTSLDFFHSVSPFLP